MTRKALGKTPVDMSSPVTFDPPKSLRRRPKKNPRHAAPDNAASARPDTLDFEFDYVTGAVPRGEGSEAPKPGSRRERQHTSRCFKCGRTTTPKLLKKLVSTEGNGYCPNCFDHLPKRLRGRA